MPVSEHASCTATSASASSSEVDDTAVAVLRRFASTNDVNETRACVLLYGDPESWVTLDADTSRELARVLLTRSQSAGYMKGEMATCRLAMSILLRGPHSTIVLDVDKVSFVTGEEQHRFCNAEASNLLRRVFKKASDTELNRLDRVLEAASKPYVPNSGKD